MSRVLKSYRAKLHVLTPVFVGSGREITKKEYRLIPAESKIAIYDPAELYMLLKREGKDINFESFLLDDRFSDLNTWFRENRINPQSVSNAVCYYVSWGDRLELGKSKTQIMEFIKDPYGNPYIPGSSIKGMLRTILMDYKILKCPESYKNLANAIRNYRCNRADKKNYKNEALKVEGKAFRLLRHDEEKPLNAVNDILQGLIVSDSNPLKVDDLVLCQKVDYHKDKSKKPLNLLRECVRPGTEIEFSITIDSSVCKFDAATIMKAIEAFNDMYYEEFLKKFESAKRPAGTVFLGGGVGFVSKTFIYSMFNGDEGVKITSEIFRNTLKPRVFNEHKHMNDTQIGVSPHVLKCTNYHGKCFQMGMCRFEMKEEEI